MKREKNIHHGGLLSVGQLGVPRSIKMSVSRFFSSVKLRVTPWLILLLLCIIASCGGDNGTSPKTNKITITFNTDGGGEIQSIEIDEGGVLPADYLVGGTKIPTKASNRFTGWKKGADAVTAATTFSESTELTAQWVRQVKVIFNLGKDDNGQNVAGTPPGPFFLDAVANVSLGASWPTALPVRTGYEFYGWYNSEMQQYNGTTPIPIADAEFTLIALWIQEGGDEVEYAQNPAIHPGNHFVETISAVPGDPDLTGGVIKTTAGSTFNANGLFSNIERGAGVLTSQWYRTTVEGGAGEAIDFRQSAAGTGTPHELSLPFSWSESQAGVYWYWVVVTNTNVSALIQSVSTSTTQNRLKVIVQ